jgi:hypothetical protein
VDQLTAVRQSGEAFSELEESTPTFPPTFKVELFYGIFALYTKFEAGRRVEKKNVINFLDNYMLTWPILLYSAFFSDVRF